MQKENSCEEVIVRHSDMVYRLAFSLVKNRADADDIYQEVFLRYIKAGQKFDSGDHERAWFIRVTINCCKNYWKSAWVQRRAASWETMEAKDSKAAFPEADAESGIEEQRLIGIVKQLPEKYRIVSHLFYYEEMSIEEISRITGIKVSTVRTRLTRARGRLKEKLGGI